MLALEFEFVYRMQTGFGICSKVLTLQNLKPNSCF